MQCTQLSLVAAEVWTSCPLPLQELDCIQGGKTSQQNHGPAARWGACFMSEDTICWNKLRLWKAPFPPLTTRKVWPKYLLCWIQFRSAVTSRWRDFPVYLFAHSSSFKEKNSRTKYFGRKKTLVLSLEGAWPLFVFSVNAYLPSDCFQGVQSSEVFSPLPLMNFTNAGHSQEDRTRSFLKNPPLPLSILPSQHHWGKRPHERTPSN